MASVSFGEVRPSIPAPDLLTHYDSSSGGNVRKTEEGLWWCLSCQFQDPRDPCPEVPGFQPEPKRSFLAKPYESRLWSLKLDTSESWDLGSENSKLTHYRGYPCGPAAIRPILE